MPTSAIDRQRRQLPAERSDVQDGARSDAVGSGIVFAVDDLAVGKSAGGSRPVAHGPRHGRSLLRVLSQGSQTDHPRHRRHVRRGPWRPAVAAVNAHYDEYGFQPIVVFDGEGRFVTAVLRPAKRPSGKEIKPFLRRLLRAIRAHWPNTEILLRADSHYCGPEVLDWCRASALDYILGVAPTTTLRRHVESLEASVKARFEAAPRDGKLRRFKEFFDGAQSWSRVERIIARVEAGAEGSDTRFVVTNLNKRNARVLYEDVYCRRGQAENHIKSW